MAKYIDAIQKGIAAAKDAERNRAEIDAVFRELNEQLGIETGNRIAIQRRQFTDHGEPFNLAYLFRPEKYWALAAVFLPSDKVAATEIAKWDQGKDGYPCRVKIGGDQVACEDRAALEAVLETLLSDPTVGEVLLKYLAMPLPQGQDEGAGNA